jgi:hypothetical protein
MEKTREEALALLRRWESQKPKLNLWLSQSGTTLQTVCFVRSVSDDALALSYGYPAFGNGMLTLPLQAMKFDYCTPADLPLSQRAAAEPYFVCYLDIEPEPPFTFHERCRIGEFRPEVAV